MNIDLIKSEAKQGLAFAQYLLGECYELGQEVPHDPQEAFEWFEKAANQGYAQAQYELQSSVSLSNKTPAICRQGEP